MIGTENKAASEFSAAHRAFYGRVFAEKMEEAFGMAGSLTTETLSPTIISMAEAQGTTAGLELRRLKFGGRL